MVFGFGSMLCTVCRFDWTSSACKGVKDVKQLFGFWINALWMCGFDWSSLACKALKVENNPSTLEGWSVSRIYLKFCVPVPYFLSSISIYDDWGRPLSLMKLIGNGLYFLRSTYPIKLAQKRGGDQDCDCHIYLNSCSKCHLQVTFLYELNQFFWKIQL